MSEIVGADAEGEDRTHGGRTRDQADVTRQAEQARHRAAPVLRHIRQRGGVVGGLEELIAGCQDDDRQHIAGYTDQVRQQRQQEGSGGEQR